MNKVLLSIIVPVYNVEKYLARCVRSLVGQTYSNLEILLIDDGSTDSSGDICDELEKEYENVRVIHKKNGGLSSARNCGIENACGDFLGFVDSDDFVHPQMYEILLKLITTSEIDVAACSYQEYAELEMCSFEDIKINELAHEQLSGLDAIEHYWDICEKYIGVSVWRKVYRKKIFDNIRFKNGIVYEDLYILPDILECCNQIVYTDKALYYYYQSPKSIIRSPFSLKKLEGLEVWKDSIIPMFEKYENVQNTRKAYLAYIDEYCKNMFLIEKSGMKNVKIPREYRRYYHRLAFHYKVLNPNLGIKEKVMYFISLFSMKLSYRYVQIFMKQLGV